MSVTEYAGRKWALNSSCVIFLVGAILMTAATHQLDYICEHQLPVEIPRHPV